MNRTRYFKPEYDMYVKNLTSDIFQEQVAYQELKNKSLQIKILNNITCFITLEFFIFVRFIEI